MKQINKYILTFTAFAVMLTSCKAFIDNVPLPQTSLTEDLVFSEDATATAAIAGIYNKLSNSGWASGDYSGLSVYEAVYADELRLYSPEGTPNGLVPFYYNNVIATDATVSATWSSCYNLIYESNKIIEGLAKSTGVTENTRKQLTGEALFMRAFCHFYLVNLFGDIPYIKVTDYITNSKVKRTPSATVYENIVADLLSAKENLTNAYPGTGKRTRVNKAAAAALLARVYLYKREWANAEEEATGVIANTDQYELLQNPNSVFLKNSREAIWQLLPYGYESFTSREGEYFILSTTPTGRTSLSDNLLGAFEQGDKRRRDWSDTLTVGQSNWYYPYKYKAGYSSQASTEYSMVLRVAEQYLIRAEARAMQNKLTGANSAQSDINAIRNRAGLLNTTASTQTQLINAIKQERRVELFTEWGHRFFDLKRWGELDAVLSSVKSGWNSNDALLPIPQSEILANSNLTQNQGY